MILVCTISCLFFFSFTHDAPSEFLAQFSFFAEESTLVLMLTPSFYNRLTKTVVWLDILFFYTATVCTQVSEIAYVILEMELIELQPSVLMTDCPLVSKTDGVFHVADRWDVISSIWLQCGIRLHKIESTIRISREKPNLRYERR